MEWIGEVAPVQPVFVQQLSGFDWRRSHAVSRSGERSCLEWVPEPGNL